MGAATSTASPTYERRQPEKTALYKCVQENLATFLARVESEARSLPRFVTEEFEGFLSCGILSAGFARVHCGSCGYDRLVA